MRWFKIAKNEGFYLVDLDKCIFVSCVEDKKHGNYLARFFMLDSSSLDINVAEQVAEELYHMV